MTPQASWTWLAGYVLLPPLFAYTLGALAYLWLGESVYRGRISLDDIIQFWSFLVGLWVMLSFVIEVRL